MRAVTANVELDGDGEGHRRPLFAANEASPAERRDCGERKEGRARGQRRK
jgi:hypothetical protein